MSTKPIFCCLTLLVCAIPGVEAQDRLPTEQQALEMKGRGHYGEAGDAFVKLLEGCTSGPRDAAMAEYYAVLAELMASRTGNQDLAETIARATDSQLAHEYPALRDRLLHISWEIAKRHGDLALATSLARKLGVLRRFWLIGPFENERGSGYDQGFPPEKELDLEAAYPGKIQPLRWRQMPSTTGLLEQIPLAAMLRPNQQALAYASLALVSEQEQDVILHLGCSESYKVFLNGEELAGRDVSRSYSPDQEAIALRLRGGANLLLLKICAQEGSFEFSARLRTRQGEAVQGVLESLDPEDMHEAAKTSSGARAEPLVALGARAFFSEQIEKANSVTDKFRLALLLALDQIDDPTRRRDQKLLRQVVEELPDFASARYLLAYTRGRSTSLAEELEENLVRQDYLHLLRIDPEHVEALRSLAELELSMNGTLENSEALLHKALEVNPNFRLGELMLGGIYRREQLAELADQALVAAARPDSDGRRPPQALHALLRTRIDQGSWEEAIEIAELLLTEDYGPTSIRETTDLYLGVGKPKKAIAILEDAELRLPYMEYAGKKLAEIYRAQGELEQSLGALGEWLSKCPDDDDALLRMATLQGLLGHKGQRLELLRSALTLNPNRKTEQRLLEYLEADELPFYAGYQQQFQAVAESDQGPPPDWAQANDPYYYLLQQVVIRAYRNGTRSSYKHQIIQVLTEQGAQDLSQHYVQHFSGEQRARLLMARVHRADGEVLAPEIKGSFVRFPPLKTGDRIELQSRVDDLAPSFFGDYFGLLHRFASADGAPVNRSELTLILDPGRNYHLQPANQAPAGVTTEDSKRREIHRFVMRNIARRELEMREPAWTEIEPLLRVTTYSDWNQFSTWWWNLIRRQSDVSPAMRTKVQELVAGLNTDQEKIDAIYRFVTTNIRYKAWEFGVHGYKPYSTPVIFERRHGDCKDKAFLLNAMLGEIGVDAFPALIHADPLRSSDDLSLPMVEHFNHCISYLPPSGDRPALYLDGTATYHPMDTLPDMDKGAKVLVVKNGSGTVQDIPWGEAEDNVDALDYRIELSANGDATVDYRYRPTHNQAIWLRALLGNEPGKHRENLERVLARSFGDLEIKELSTSDPLDLASPMKVDVQFLCEKLAPQQDQGLALKARFTGSSIQRLSSSPKREFPLLLGSPSARVERIHYSIPSGYAPLDLPSDTDLQSRFGSFHLHWSYKDDVVSVERSQSWQQPRIAAEEYPEFREYASRVDAADQQLVVVSPGGR